MAAAWRERDKPGNRGLRAVGCEKQARTSQSTKQNMDAVEINTTVSRQNEGQGIVSTVEICRVCLLGNLVMRDLFLESEVASLSAKAMSFANVKVRHVIQRLCCLYDARARRT